jgi:HAD superfamily hydrolase (TIGR01509 family)
VNFEAVIFDCDGVLADSEPAWALTEVELSRRYGLDRYREPFITTQGVSMRETVRLLIPELTASELDQAEQLFIDLAVEVVPGRVRALPGAVELASTLAGAMAIGVASNSPRSVLGEVLKAIGVASYVDGYVSADQVAAPKPAPFVYLRACELLGVRPERTLVIEDSSTGVQAARAAGCTVIQVAAPGLRPDDTADAYVESLFDVAATMADLSPSQ